MGNILALDQKSNGVNEEIPYLKQMQLNAKRLARSLEVPSLLDVDYQIDNTSNNYSIFEQARSNDNVLAQEGGGNNFSETSPFISSELYNNMINQQGGGDSSSYTDLVTSNDSDPNMIAEDAGTSEKMDKNSMDKDTMNMISNVEDSSSTSDSDEAEMKAKMKDMEERVINESGNDSESENQNISSEGSMGSYLSSSAHTDGVDSSSENLTTISMKNKNFMSESINTSDINMISVEE